MPKTAAVSTRVFEAIARCPLLPASTRCVSNGHGPVDGHVFAAVRDNLVGSYLERTPTAGALVDALIERGALIHNDHVALRSFVDSKGTSGLSFLAPLFMAFGYADEGPLHIPGLPVNARWYEPPEETNWPKVFISELRVAELPPAAAAVVYAHIDGYYASIDISAFVRRKDADEITRLMDDPPWRPTAAEVDAVRAAGGDDPAMRSALEYAAWTLTHGHRWNHFTVLVNALRPEGLGAVDGVPHSLAEANVFVREEGFALNAAGGADGFTQGSRALHLEQSSTVADVLPFAFACGTVKTVPHSFLELIFRHEGFRGFLGQNARGIFSSTDAGRKECASAQ